MDMDELLNRLRRFRDERGWSKFHTPKDLAISVSVEAAELLELFQWRPTDEPPDPKLVTALRSECADVLLYLVLLSDAVGFDLADAAKEKISFNELRFPRASSQGVAKPVDQLEYPE